MKKFKLTRKERNAQKAQFLNDLYASFSNLTKEQQTVRRAELLINPIYCTYSIGGDSYKKVVTDFQRNGKTIIIKSFNEKTGLAIESDNGKKFTWCTRTNQMHEFPYYKASTGTYGFVNFGFCESKRDLSF